MVRVALSQFVRKPARGDQSLIDARIAELEGRFQMLSLEVQRLNRNGAQIDSKEHLRS
jgi:hypothetical protein